MEDKEYIKWFKKNRNIHRLLPVFSSNNNIIRNHFYSAYISTRDRILHKVKDAFRKVVGI